MSSESLAKRIRAILARAEAPKDPARVFDAVLEKKTRAYETLKQAVAGVLYLRNKIEGEIRERRAEIARVHDEIRRALDLADDGRALVLVRQKQALDADLQRMESDLAEVGRESDDAKGRLLAARDEIRALERERLRAMTAIAGVRARTRMGEALDIVGDDRSDPVLEAARADVAKMAMERTLERELSGAALEERILSASAKTECAHLELDEATRELAAIKARYFAKKQRALQLAE